LAVLKDTVRWNIEQGRKLSGDDVGRAEVLRSALYQRVREKHPSIGYTTVYRTMKLLCDAGLSHERHFDDGITRYEIDQEHHDHLMCLRCGKIIEFDCQMIETAQDEIVERYGFRLLRHRHELYGHCPECQRREGDR
ncbi:MAG: transcriptional repressor, partial [bacterium]|nr:transcriptional repressor [bacterium]